MGRLISKIAGSPEARTTYRAAKGDLERVTKRDRTDSDAYLDANSAVIKAEQNLPWYRR